jgi:hypothetical protein
MMESMQGVMLGLSCCSSPPQRDRSRCAEAPPAFGEPAVDVGELAPRLLAPVPRGKQPRGGSQHNAPSQPWAPGRAARLVRAWGRAGVAGLAIGRVERGSGDVALRHGRPVPFPWVVQDEIIKALARTRADSRFTASATGGD